MLTSSATMSSGDAISPAPAAAHLRHSWDALPFEQNGTNPKGEQMGQMSQMSRGRPNMR